MIYVRKYIRYIGKPFPTTELQIFVLYFYKIIFASMPLISIKLNERTATFENSCLLFVEETLLLRNTKCITFSVPKINSAT